MGNGNLRCRCTGPKILEDTRKPPCETDPHLWVGWHPSPVARRNRGPRLPPTTFPCKLPLFCLAPVRLSNLVPCETTPHFDDSALFAHPEPTNRSPLPDRLIPHRSKSLEGASQVT